MTRRPAIIALGLLLAGLVSSSWGQAALAAPLALSVGLIPASGPAGMTVTAVGSGWNAPNSPYLIVWEIAGGTQLGTFTPDGSGSWSKSITIPGSASNGSHQVVACEGYGDEFQGCASAGFNVTSPTATPSRTPTRTPSRTPTTAPPGFVTPTFTFTPTSPYDRGCTDGIARISPTNYADLGGVPTVDLVMEVVLTDATTARVVVYRPRSDEIYTQWPDPLPGTSVDAVADPVEANRSRLTVRDYPLPLGPQL